MKVLKEMNDLQDFENDNWSRVKVQSWAIYRVHMSGLPLFLRFAVDGWYM
jgi:hypothetical protein